MNDPVGRPAESVPVPLALAELSSVAARGWQTALRLRESYPVPLAGRVAGGEFESLIGDLGEITAALRTLARTLTGRDRSTLPAATPGEIAVRDGWRCFRCGRPTVNRPHSCHHRIRRADGGDGWANQVHLCGTGTTACHGWLTEHPRDARATGFIVTATGSADPALVPVDHWLLGAVLLGDDGTVTAWRST